MDIVGQMREVVTFKVNTPAAQGAGGVDNYADLLTTRGYLRKASGNRSLSFSDIVEDNTWKLTVRYQDTLWNALTVSVKVIINGRTFALSEWKKKDEDRGYIEFSLNEQRR